MTLSHSRMTAVVWSRRMNQLAWHHVHNEAFERIGGVAAVNRIDNLKTGVSRGAGPTGEINPTYRAYARTMGFHIDPHEVRQPQQKGKVERRVGAVKRLDLSQRFDSLEELQRYTDEQLRKDAHTRPCPVTGQSVFETWQSERELLRPLPATLPEPFDLIRNCPVHKDATIRFEGRTYTVPFAYIRGTVEVRGRSGFLEIVDRKTGEILRKYPRQTDETLLIDPTRLKHRKYMSSNLVVLDEFGIEPLDRDEASLLFRVVNYRYAKSSSMAITTNKGIASWPSVLAGDEVLAGAILDRLLHNAVVLNIEGRSYRLKELDAQLRAVASSNGEVDGIPETAGPTANDAPDADASDELDAGEETGSGDQTSKF